MKKINFAGVIGLVLCFAAIIFGIATNGGIKTLMNFVHVPSLIVTLGGSLFAVLATADSFADYVDGLKSFFEAYQKQMETTETISEQIYELSDVARKEGLLALEERAQQIQDEFFGRGIRLVVDGTDPDMVRGIMENEMLHREDRAKRRIRFWQDLGACAPAWGMIGTLLGLVNMMRSMGADTGAIGAGMSLALITTLYGSVVANWICIPVARKLEKNCEQDSIVMEVIVEGVLSIQAGENSRIIREKINSILENEQELAA